MNGFAEWVERRRKILGFARQIDLATAAGVSLSVVQVVESSGSLEGRSRASRRLLAAVLRVSENTLDQLARGEIDDAPIEGAGGQEVDLAEWLADLTKPDRRDLRRAVFAKLTPAQASDLARGLIERLARDAPPTEQPAPPADLSKLTVVRNGEPESTIPARDPPPGRGTNPRNPAPPERHAPAPEPKRPARAK